MPRSSSRYCAEASDFDSLGFAPLFLPARFSAQYFFIAAIWRRRPAEGVVGERLVRSRRAAFRPFADHTGCAA